ncbi:hypothetical protein W97_06528 [Coniosporium apollinis CBS 100218]|uniref:AAA+ ATPase domain-containing protein n=1 Tax=Coniosporium apollinis (strain CBS 100218) TaxID=1168221 RepID=R7YZ87_CONA1|nr:uncharacterized protein W97_06528 [Coniosporium apollinis CBS 100218]EON67275.1 hypothetical protein W97_06528 [Coniosporium apollinis CBS 100218]
MATPGPGQGQPPVDVERLEPWASWHGLNRRLGSSAKALPTCIIQGQMNSQFSNCDIYAGESKISGRATDYKTEVFMHGASLASFIELRLRFSPSYSNNTDAKKADDRDRMSIFYPTFMPDKWCDGRESGDVVTTLASTEDRDLRGILGLKRNFSSALYDVEFLEFKNSPLATVAGVQAFPGTGKQFYMSFKTDQPIAINHSRAVGHKPAHVQEVVAEFRKVMTFVGQIQVHIQPNPALAYAYGMHFFAQPFPPPPSYWPFLKADNEKAPVIDVGHGTTFYQFPDFVEKVFAIREQPFFRRSGNQVELRPAKTPLELWAGLPAIHQFVTSRQYQAYVLGAFTDEELSERALMGSCYSGTYDCYEILQAAFHHHKPQRAVLLFAKLSPFDIDNLDGLAGHRPDGVLPQPGERVAISDPDDDTVDWSGSVISIPEGLASEVSFANCCIRAFMPVSTGLVIEPRTHKYHLRFGFSGRPTRVMRKTINNLMTLDVSRGTNIGDLRQIVLAQDPSQYSSPQTKKLGTTTVQIINDACKKFNLNKEQIEVVRHAFTRRTTIVHAPPGTGKTYIAQCITEIATKMKMRYLVVAPSNQAVNVIHARITNDQYQEGRVFRVYTETQETLYDDDDDEVFFAPGRDLPASDNSGDSPPFDVLPNLSQQATAAFRDALQPETAEPGPNSLAAHIRKRLQLLSDDRARFNEQFTGEQVELDALLNARQTTSMAATQDQAAVADAIKRQRQQDLQLRRQYARYADGNCVTNSSATSKVLRDVFPKILIQDESAQGSEPEVLAASILCNRSLEHRIMVGDHNQLMPFQRNSNAILGNQGKLTYQQRLIEAGFPYHTLKVQYRMHPDISEWSRDTNEPQLQNSSDPSLGRGFQGWEDWLKKFLTWINVKQFSSHSVMISPTDTPGSQVPFGSRTIGATRTRYNFQHAAVVFQTALHLILVGKCPPKDILILAAYAGQVRLLTKICGHFKETKDVQIGTWDSSQGSEAEVVIIDPVRTLSTTGQTLGFLNDPHRLNVVMTRARTGRIVVVNKDLTKNQHPTKGVRDWNSYLTKHTQKGWSLDYPMDLLDYKYRNTNQLKPFLPGLEKMANEFLANK